MAPCEWCEKQSDQLTPIRDWEEHGSFALANTAYARPA